MTQHSIIEHRANYFYVRLEDDYLALCEKCNQEIEALNLPERQTSGPADCKAMILSVLEHWMNSKRFTAKSEYDLYVYFTYEEWEQQLRYRYKRSVILRCLKEMEKEGQWLDEQGDIHTGLTKVRHHVQNTYAYLLNVPVVQGLITQLPEQSPYGPRPKAQLGRPRKNHSKINGLKTDGINLNRLETDGITEIPSKNTRNNDEIPFKNKRSFYTQISNNTDYNKTQIVDGDDATASHRVTHNENVSQSLEEHIEHEDYLVRRRREMRDNAIETTLAEQEETLPDADHDSDRRNCELHSGDSNGHPGSLPSASTHDTANSYSPTRQRQGEIDGNSVVDRGPDGRDRHTPERATRGSLSRVPGIVPDESARGDALAPGTIRAESGEVDGSGIIPTGHRDRAGEHSGTASVYIHRADGLIHTAIPATAEHLERVTATQQQDTHSQDLLSGRVGRSGSTIRSGNTHSPTLDAPTTVKGSAQATRSGGKDGASKQNPTGVGGKTRKKAEPVDLFTSLDAAVQAVIVEWQGIFKKPVPVTEALVKQATTLEAFKPEPGEVAACRLWMYQTDTKKWYSTHGLDLGHVAREFEKFRSLANVPVPAQPEPTKSNLYACSSGQYGMIDFMNDPRYNPALQQTGAR